MASAHQAMRRGDSREKMQNRRRPSRAPETMRCYPADRPPMFFTVLDAREKQVSPRLRDADGSSPADPFAIR